MGLSRLARWLANCNGAAPQAARDRSGRTVGEVLAASAIDDEEEDEDEDEWEADLAAFWERAVALATTGPGVDAEVPHAGASEPHTASLKGPNAVPAAAPGSGGGGSMEAVPPPLPADNPLLCGPPALHDAGSVSAAAPEHRPLTDAPVGLQRLEQATAVQPAAQSVAKLGEGAMVPAPAPCSTGSTSASQGAGTAPTDVNVAGATGCGEFSASASVPGTAATDASATAASHSDGCTSATSSLPHEIGPLPRGAPCLAALAAYHSALEKAGAGAGNGLGTGCADASSTLDRDAAATDSANACGDLDHTVSVKDLLRATVDTCSALHREAESLRKDAVADASAANAAKVFECACFGGARPVACPNLLHTARPWHVLRADESSSTTLYRAAPGEKGPVFHLLGDAVRSPSKRARLSTRSVTLLCARACLRAPVCVRAGGTGLCRVQLRPRDAVGRA